MDDNPTYRVVVTASRSLRDPAICRVALRALLGYIGTIDPNPQPQGQITIVHGDAIYGDQFFKKEAARLGMIVEAHPIQEEAWKRLGKAAGPERNREMLDDERGCDLVVAVRKGGIKSKGTTSCIEEARKRGKIIIVFDLPSDPWLRRFD